MRLHVPGLLLAFLLFPAAAAAQELVTNGDFETGDLSGWTVVNQGPIDTLIYQAGQTGSLSGWPLPPPNGTYGVFADMGDPSFTFIYQDITLPATGAATFSASVYYANLADAQLACPNPPPLPTTPDWEDITTLDTSQGIATGQQFRIDIMDPSAPPDDMGAGILQTIFATSDASPAEFGPQHVTAGLGAYAGQSIRLRFLNYNTICYLHSALDDVSVVAGAPPAGPPPLPVPADHPGFLALLVLALMGFGFAVLRSRPA